MSVKTIIWDVETSPIVAYTWGLYGHDIQPGNIITDRGILCICWKTLGERTVHSVSVGPDCSERKLIETFRAAIDDADILVAHNGDKFDLKHLTAKLIEYDITPLHKVNTVDTLKEVKKVAKFSRALQRHRARERVSVEPGRAPELERPRRAASLRQARALDQAAAWIPSAVSGVGMLGDQSIPPGEQRIEAIRDPVIYQKFFARLSKAVFLEAHKI